MQAYFICMKLVLLWQGSALLFCYLYAIVSGNNAVFIVDEIGMRKVICLISFAIKITVGRMQVTLLILIHIYQTAC